VTRILSDPEFLVTTEIEYSSAAGAVLRFSRRVAKDSEIATLIKHAMPQIDNE
jgi:hypothetical protein